MKGWKLSKKWQCFLPCREYPPTLGAKWPHSSGNGQVFPSWSIWVFTIQTWRLLRLTIQEHQTSRFCAAFSSWHLVGEHVTPEFRTTPTTLQPGAIITLVTNKRLSCGIRKGISSWWRSRKWSIFSMTSWWFQPLRKYYIVNGNLPQKHWKPPTRRKQESCKNFQNHLSGISGSKTLSWENSLERCPFSRTYEQQESTPEFSDVSIIFNNLVDMYMNVHWC